MLHTGIFYISLIFCHFSTGPEGLNDILDIPEAEGMSRPVADGVTSRGSGRASDTLHHHNKYRGTAHRTPVMARDGDKMIKQARGTTCGWSVIASSQDTGPSQ